MPDAKLLAHSDPVDLTGWGFGFGNLDEQIAPAVAEAIANTLAEDPPHLSLTFIWEDEDGIGGPPVADPLAVHLTLPFSDPNGVTFQFSIVDLIDDFIGNLTDKWGPWSGHDADLRNVLSRALRAQADRLDALPVKNDADGDRT